VTGTYQDDLMDSETFAALSIKHEWLVRGVLVRNEPAVVGGPKKTLKTSFCTDLAVSLANGKKFLDKFEVDKKVRVAFLSGESGKATLQQLARRVCTAKQVPLAGCGVFWGFNLPRLSSADDLLRLVENLDRRDIEVLLLDPLYLSLLTGSKGVNPANLFDMGPLLSSVTQACLGVGITPILVHHTSMTGQRLKGRHNEPLDLEDLAFAGVGEFARQWLILSRREPFDPETGDHKLWLKHGGSASHGGIYAVDVNEGVLKDTFDGKKWEVSVVSASTAVKATVKKREEKKELAKATKEKGDQEKVLKVLEGFTVAKTAPEIAELVGFGTDKTRAILNKLLEDLFVVRARVQKPFGTGRKDQLGWRRLMNEERGFTVEQGQRLRNGDAVEEVLTANNEDKKARPTKE